jgi:hypothetical protein
VKQHQDIVRHLRSLPQEIRQPYDWTEFRRRAREHARVRSSRHKRHLAIAAVLVLMVAAIAAWLRVTRPGMPGSFESSPLYATNTRAKDSLEAVAERADIAERWLAGLPSEPIVVDVGTRAAVAGLEDRIAQLDDVLSVARVEGTQPAKLAILEEQRARLVNSLVQVRYAEALVSGSR